jgi:hypothetical protein
MSRAGAMKMSIVGDAALMKKLGTTVVEDMRRALGVGLYLEGNEIMADSARKVPLDLGTLKGSAYVTHPTESARGPEVEIGYGGAAKKYAEPQHERLDYVHPDIGEAKYLESVVNDRLAQFPARVRAYARRSLKGAAGLRGQFPQRPPEGAPPAPSKRKRRKGGAK